MEKLEKCVEKKVGPVGCTNDEHPKNLTIPMMPTMDQAAMEAQAAQQPPVRLQQLLKQYLHLATRTSAARNGTISNVC